MGKLDSVKVKDLSTKALCLLSLLHLTIHRQKKIVVSSVDEIAKLAGCHTKTIDGPLKELTKNGFINSDGVFDENGDFVQAICFNKEILAEISLVTPTARESFHEPIIRDLISDMYRDLSIEKRKSTLSPINTLLLSTVLSFADENGVTNSLSQSRLKKLLAFSTAQLKSQSKKLQQLGLVNVLAAGGAERGRGRRTSTLRVNLERLRNWKHMQHDENTHQRASYYHLIIDTSTVATALEWAADNGYSFIRVEKHGSDFRKDNQGRELEALLTSVNETLTTNFDDWRQAPPEQIPPSAALTSTKDLMHLVRWVAISIFLRIVKSKWGTDVGFSRVSYDNQIRALKVELKSR